MSRFSLILPFCLTFILWGCKKDVPVFQYQSISYPIHKNIISTYFYVGKPADSSNGYNSNSSSAWDGNWKIHYGGVDDPNNRNGFYPANFLPKENPFYFALPYNDLSNIGRKKKRIQFSLLG